MKVTCVVSPAPAQEGSLARAYLETLDTYELVEALGSEAPVLFRGQLAADSALLLGGEYLKQVQILMNALLLRKYVLIPAIVGTLVEESILPYNDYPRLFTRRVSCVSALLFEGIRDADLSVEEKERRRSFLREAQKDPVALKAAAAAAFEGMDMTGVPSVGGDLTGRATAYIREHLGDPNLSLPAVCDAAGCSVQHLSRLFKQEKNTTINEFIHDERIQRATELLQDPARCPRKQDAVLLLKQVLFLFAQK